jgi:hypothetical protein
VLKIIVAVTFWFTTTDAAASLRDASRYVDLGRAISLLHLPLGGVPNIVMWGLSLGVVHGFILSIKALVFVWVGPTFFEYLYPVFVAASRISARVVTDARRAWVHISNIPLPPDDGPPGPRHDDDGPPPPATPERGDTVPPAPANEERPTETPPPKDKKRSGPGGGDNGAPKQ